MERVISTVREEIKGLKITKEVEFKLNNRQEEMLKRVSRACDCMVEDVLTYVVGSEEKTLLEELFIGELNVLEEKLVSGITQQAFGL